MKTIHNEKVIPWDLILKSLKGDADEEDGKQLDSWMMENNRHSCLWSELQYVWDNICKLNTDFNPDKLQAWQKIVWGKNASRYS